MNCHEGDEFREEEPCAGSALGLEFPTCESSLEKRRFQRENVCTRAAVRVNAC